MRLRSLFHQIKRFLLGQNSPMEELIPPSLPILPSIPTKTLIIDREIWLRGESHDSALLRPRDGKRCCLGFYCQMLGATDEEMLDVASPKGLHPSVQKRLGLYSSWFYDNENNPFSPVSRDLWDAISFNDRKVGLLLMTGWEERMTEELREKLLTDIFARHNVSVVFINQEKKEKTNEQASAE